MGACLSICLRYEDYSGLEGNNETDQLLARDYETHRKLSLAKRKDKLDKIVTSTVEKFVDISSFLDISKSVPTKEVYENNLKKEFEFGNGMIKYSIKNNRIKKNDYYFQELSSEEIDPELKDQMKLLMTKYNKKIDGELLEIGKSLTNSGKVLGKL